MARGGEFQFVERDMRAAQVKRRDLRRIGDQIGQDIAAARRDRDHPAVRHDLQGFEIDFRVFPDLRIDKALEQRREQIVEHPFLKTAFRRCRPGVADRRRTVAQISLPGESPSCASSDGSMLV